MILLLLFVALVSLAGAAFCAGAETAFLSVRRARVLHLTRAGSRKAAVIQRALRDMGRTTTTLLIGNNIAAVTYSIATSAISLRLFAGSTGRTLSGFAAAFIVLYCSEFMPKLLCSARPLRRSLQLADAYAVLEAVLRPLTALAIWFTDLFLADRKTERQKLTAVELLQTLQDRKNGVVLSDLERRLITRIVKLRKDGRRVTREALLEGVK